MDTCAIRWPSLALACLALVHSYGVSTAQGLIESEDQDEPIALILVPTDLSQATESMIKFDRNDDGKIDREEWTRLKWDDEKVRRFDINRDQHLTHVELALHYASVRLDSGIEAADSKYASKVLQRYDQNKNGRLDASEIESQNWPPDVEEFDENGDGSVSLYEIMKQFAYRRGLRRELGIESIDTNNSNRLLRQYDKDTDGKLNGDEATAAGLNVSDVDHDSDGELDGIEVATHFAKRRLKTNISPADQYQAQILFRQLDRDQDGSLSESELALTKGMQLGKADADQDGKVTESELQSYYAANRKQVGYSESELTAARRTMLRYDANNDGRLTETEYCERSTGVAEAKAQFPKIDANDDDSLTVEELAKHLAISPREGTK